MTSTSANTPYHTFFPLFCVQHSKVSFDLPPFLTDNVIYVSPTLFYVESLSLTPTGVSRFVSPEH